MQIFSVANQATHTLPAAEERCFFGTAPTLSEVNIAYGEGASEEWLVYHLTDLNEFAGQRDKLSSFQLRQLARLLSQNYYYLKVTEFELFFRRFKMARYGTFYGSIDPLIITTAIRSFLIERANEIDKHESFLRSEALKKSCGHPITREQYDALCASNVAKYMMWRTGEVTPQCYIVPRSCLPPRFTPVNYPFSFITKPKMS